MIGTSKQEGMSGAIVPGDSGRGGVHWLSIGILSGIVVLAAVLRWHAIGQSSIWIDEGASITMARMPWERFFRALCQYEANMTVYYLLLSAWLRLGDSETVVRSLSALLGTASVVAIFFLGRRLHGERVGLLAAALLSVHVFHIWFSQEARSYSLVVLFIICSLLFFIEAVENPRKRWVWFGYFTTSILAAYTHLFALLVLAAQWLSVGPRRFREIGLRRMGGFTLALGLPLMPLAAFVLLQDQGQIDWIPPTNVANIIVTLFSTCGFNPLMLILVFIGLAWILWNPTNDDDATFRMRLLLLAYSFPIVTIALLSFIKPLFFFRYFVICVPAAALIAARVLSPARAFTTLKRVIVVMISILTLGFSFFLTCGYYERMWNWAGDWRSATEHVLAHRQDGDAILFYVSAGLDAFRYYQDRVPSSQSPIPMPTIVFPEEEELSSAHLEPDYARLKRASEGHTRLWLVLHMKNTSDLPASFLDPYSKIDEKEFASISPEMSITVGLYESAEIQRGE